MLVVVIGKIPNQYSPGRLLSFISSWKNCNTFPWNLMDFFLLGIQKNTNF
jgi:hypothetical protein